MGVYRTALVPVLSHAHGRGWRRTFCPCKQEVISGTLKDTYGGVRSAVARVETCRFHDSIFCFLVGTCGCALQELARWSLIGAPRAVSVD